MNKSKTPKITSVSLNVNEKNSIKDKLVLLFLKKNWRANTSTYNKKCKQIKFSKANSCLSFYIVYCILHIFHILNRCLITFAQKKDKQRYKVIFAVKRIVILRNSVILHHNK